MQHKKIFWFAIIVMLSLCLGCETISENEETDITEISESEQTKKDIEILIELLASPSSKVGEICRRLIEYGEKAVPELGRHLDNSSYLVRVDCLYCLGEIYKHKKSPAVRALKPKIIFCLDDPSLAVRLEASALLCTLGDYSGVPVLLAALRHNKAYTRMIAAKALRDHFRLTFGYYYQDTPATREKAASSWDQWWAQNSQQYTAGNKSN
jgi:HEAT repeat protein